MQIDRETMMTDSRDAVTKNGAWRLLYYLTTIWAIGSFLHRQSEALFFVFRMNPPKKKRKKKLRGANRQKREQTTVRVQRASKSRKSVSVLRV